MLLADSIGLGIFTVSGAARAFDVTAEANVFLAVFVGVITGVGGGLLRDMMAGDPPYIFVKHIYATAAIAGALLFCALRLCVPQHIAMPQRRDFDCRDPASGFSLSAGACQSRGSAADSAVFCGNIHASLNFFVFFHKKIKKTY